MLSLITITILGISVSSWIIKIAAPGFSNNIEYLSLTSKLLRMMFPYIILISLTSLMGAILNTWNYLSIPSCSPIFLNFSIIICALSEITSSKPSIITLAWGVLIGGILQLIYQIPYIKKIDMFVKPKIQISNSGLYKVLKLMIPAVIGVSVNQFSLIINTILCSFLTPGSISWIYYADRLMEFPAGILGVTLSTILLPLLSENFSKGNKKQCSKIIDWSLRLCLILAIPSSISLCILSKPLTITLLQYGKFSNFDTTMTQQALIPYSIGLLGIMLSKVMSVSFYSHKNIKTPVRITIIVVIFTQILNLIFIGILKHISLSLSVSLGSCLNAGLLYWKLRQKNIYLPQYEWYKFFIRISISITIMILTIILFLIYMPEWSQGSFISRSCRLIIVISTSIFSYIIILRITGFRFKDLSKPV